MKKLWFFLEGDSEDFFITNLIRNKFYDKILIEKDLSEFIMKDVNDLTHNIAYCENCESVDRIPHKINEMYYMIERSLSNDILVICDVEKKLKCFTARKDKIEGRLDEIVDITKLKYIFFKPLIEYFYWQCKKIIRKIIEIEYKNKFGRNINHKILIPTSPANFLYDLKNLFREYDLKYREASFAESFFPRVNYDECKDRTLNRAIVKIKYVLNDL